MAENKLSLWTLFAGVDMRYHFRDIHKYRFPLRPASDGQDLSTASMLTLAVMIAI